MLLERSVMTGLTPRAAAFFADTIEIRFLGPFSPGTAKKVLAGQKNTVVAGGVGVR
jgi:hypothetical protein